MDALWARRTSGSPATTTTSQLFAHKLKKSGKYPGVGTGRSERICGLFNGPDEADVFLKFYLSFDWAETGDYEIGEVFA